MLSPILAQNTGVPLPTPVLNNGLSAPVVTVVVGIIGLLVIAALILTVLNLWKVNFGRKPTIEVDLQGKADSKDVSALKVDIKGFVTTKEFDAIKEEHRLRTLGLEKQISDSRHAWREEFGAWQTHARERDEDRAERLKRVEQQMTNNGQSIAAVSKQADLILAQLHNLDAKVDRNNESRRPVRA